MLSRELVIYLVNDTSGQTRARPNGLIEIRCTRQIGIDPTIRILYKLLKLERPQSRQTISLKKISFWYPSHPFFVLSDP